MFDRCASPATAAWFVQPVAVGMGSSMQRRPSQWLVAFAVMLMTGCSDANEGDALERHRSSMPTQPSKAPTEGAPDADAATPPAGETTASSQTDSGAPVLPPSAADVFSGAGVFASQVASSSHNAGKNCMSSCHNHGFTVAGTLTDRNGNGLAGAEVRLVDATGKAFSVHTGTNGNFHTSSSWTGPAKVGVRTANAKALMVGNVSANDGGCNACHAAGAPQPAIHLP